MWTINDVSQLDETIIRRMSLAIELKVPPVAAREKIWQRLMVKHGMELPQKELRELANLDISPAIANNAIRFAKHAIRSDNQQIGFQGHSDLAPQHEK